MEYWIWKQSTNSYSRIFIVIVLSNFKRIPSIDQRQLCLFFVGSVSWLICNCNIRIYFERKYLIIFGRKQIIFIQHRYWLDLNSCRWSFHHYSNLQIKNCFLFWFINFIDCSFVIYPNRYFILISLKRFNSP